MPFTFSHPAIILPLTFLSRKWFSLSGLIIGSVTPDFEYFIRMEVKSIYSHTLSGVLWFDLPLGIFLLFIFHNLIKERLIDNLPLMIRSRLTELYHLNWNNSFLRNWFVISYSVLMGAASHIFWDGFTHNHGFFVDLIPFLSRGIAFFSFEVPVFKMLQHLSTVVGGFAIILYIKKLPLNEHNRKKINYKYWFLILIITAFITILRLFTILSIYQYGNIIVTIISALLISLTLTPLLFKRFITT